MGYLTELSNIYNQRARRYLPSEDLRNVVNQTFKYIEGKRRNLPETEFVKFENVSNMNKIVRSLYEHKELAYRQGRPYRRRMKKAYEALRRCC